MKIKKDESLYAECNFCLEKDKNVIAFNGDELKHIVSICEDCLDDLYINGKLVFKRIREE